jgi:hypothetical protein
MLLRGGGGGGGACGFWKRKGRTGDDRAALLNVWRGFGVYRGSEVDGVAFGGEGGLVDDLGHGGVCVDG